VRADRLGQNNPPTTTVDTFRVKNSGTIIVWCHDEYSCSQISKDCVTTWKLYTANLHTSVEEIKKNRSVELTNP
jgi:hypothetical protein